MQDKDIKLIPQWSPENAEKYKDYVNLQTRISKLLLKQKKITDSNFHINKDL